MTKTLIGHPEPAPNLADPAAERRLLGGILRSATTSDHAIAVVDAADFTTARHRAVFRAAAAVHGRGQPCDPVTVAAELTRHAVTPDASTADDLQQLAAQAPPEPVVTYYLAIVRDLARLRRGLPRPGPDRSSTPGPSPERTPPVPMRGFLLDEDETDRPGE